MNDKMKELERQRLLEKLEQDPDLINRLNKREALNNFKVAHNVIGASPLKCPSCAAQMPSPGTLWGPKLNTTNEFVCRKCKLEWRVDCLSKPNDLLMKELKEQRIRERKELE